MQLCHTKKFFHFSLRFQNSDPTFNIFQEKMTLLADVFLNLETPKNAVRQMSKKSCFRVPFNNQHGNWAETMLKYERQHLYHIYGSL